MANQKINYDDSMVKDEFLSNLANPNGQAEKKDKEQKEETPHKTLCNFYVKKETLKEWKRFCIDKDINITTLAKLAINHYIKEVNNGNIDL